jgi:uncharacterized membrane-anchored protein
MQTIAIPVRAKALNDLLKKARRRTVILETSDGHRDVLTAIGNWEGFDVGNSEDIGEEVKRTIQNKRLMKFLAERRKTTKGRSKSLDDIEKELGLV